MEYKKLICIKCGKEMRLDDVDYNFPGNSNYYYVCDNCNICAIRKIRFNKDYIITYCDEDGNIIKEIKWNLKK